MARNVTGQKIFVEGEERASVFPTNREETLKDFVLDGRRIPFAVEGGIYSSTLLLRGVGTLMGPAFAIGDMRLEMGDQSGFQRLLSGVSAGHSIVSSLQARCSVDESPAAVLDGIRFVIRGDVTSCDKVVLRNTLVIGSISAPAIDLHACVVLGCLFARQAPGHIHATCSSFGLYRSRRITLEGPTTLFVAGGSSEQEPEFVDYKLDDGSVVSWAMRLLPLCRISGVGCGMPPGLPDQVIEGAPTFDGCPGIGCPYWLHQCCAYASRISLHKCDFMEMLVSIDEQTSDVYAVNVQGASPEELRLHKEEGKQTNWFLGAQSRALDFGAVQEAENRFQQALHAVFAYEHLTPEARVRANKEIEADLNLSGDEVRLLKLATEGLDRSR